MSRLWPLPGRPAALGADQQVDHFRDVRMNVERDFCGTGQDIDVAFDVRVTQWFAPHKADYKETTTGKVIFTNPRTGDVVLLRFAGQTSVVNVSGAPEAAMSRRTRSRGSPS